ncbi:hypothetical protein EVAR_31430_1 [Eumeta japonica]|uniref:Uncharacterized protein n=1 Tax=Eumeta variegata TaxID=151549 RepID=A0A4C1UXX0_EUMVA|nr:hypothetical protein EVAR_31430_1 [Eumeta japonica]
MASKARSASPLNKSVCPTTRSFTDATHTRAHIPAQYQSFPAPSPNRRFQIYSTDIEYKLVGYSAGRWRRFVAVARPQTRGRGRATTYDLPWKMSISNL